MKPIKNEGPKKESPKLNEGHEKGNNRNISEPKPKVQPAPQKPIPPTPPKK